MNAPVSRVDTKIRKRSVMISGHATSVSLEQAFWQRLKAIAKYREVSVNALIAEIDGERPPPGGGRPHRESLQRHPGVRAQEYERRRLTPLEYPPQQVHGIDRLLLLLLLLLLRLRRRGFVAPPRRFPRRFPRRS